MVKGLRKIDYLIVGQGLAGSALAVKLVQAGKEVLVIDEETDLTASKKAGGIYNPITGRQMIKTWLADDLFPVISPFYKELEELFQARFHHEIEIYRPFFSWEELNDWEGKASNPQYHQYIRSVHRSSINLKGFLDPFGGLSVNFSGYVDLPVLLTAARKWLRDKGMYQTGVFFEERLKETNGGFEYEDLETTHIIYCQGSKAMESRYWRGLPFKLVKGEILDLKLDMETEILLNRGIFMLPRAGIFRVGSTYNHSTLDYEPTELGKKELVEKMQRIYPGSYEVVRHTAGIRPATFDRRPFIGSHPEQPNVGIFNGFGAKGVSLVPFFVTQYVNYLLRGVQLIPEADVKRVQWR